MSIKELLTQLRQLGVKIWAEDLTLRYQAAKGVLTPELLAELSRRKLEIISFLQQVNSENRYLREPISPVPRSGYLPQSFAQQRMWLLSRLGWDSAAYHIPFAAKITGSLNILAFEKSLNRIVSRHESLRTTFTTVDEKPVQIVAGSWEIPVQVVDLRRISEPEKETETRRLVEAEVQKPFDLAAGPLIRCVLFQLGATEFVLLLCMHHIISDGGSMDVFIREFQTFYEAYVRGEMVELPYLEIQYADYAVWQQNMFASEEFKKQEKFWADTMQGAIPVLNMPLDFPRPDRQTFTGQVIPFTISQDTVARLREIGSGQGVTLNILLFSIYAILLYYFSGQVDLVIGLLVAGRRRPELDQLIGIFINFLPIRIRVNPEGSFASFLNSVKDTMLNAYDNQDFPFEKIVETISPKADLSRNPIFDTMLVFHNQSNSLDYLEIEGLQFSKCELTRNAATLDFKVDVFLGEQGELNCWLEFNTNLFKEETMRNFGRHFQALLEKASNSQGRSISDLQDPSLEEIRHIAAKRTPGPVSKITLNLVVSATFTAEPVEDYLRWWLQQFEIEAVVRFASYNQVYQDLLDPASLLSTNFGLNLLLIRFEDLIRADHSSEQVKCQKLERSFAELTGILAKKPKNTPYFVGIFPVSTHLGLRDSVISRITDLNIRWQKALAEIENVHSLDFTELAGLYNISDVFDPIKDKTGHLPFSEEYYAAMGTAIARRIYAWHSQPFKVIALDCDNTLWKGVCGEDGALGVQVEEPFALFQQVLIQKYHQGMLLVLCSKNNEADVWEVFAKNPAMILKKEHFANWKINWSAKSENLYQLASDLNLGIDSFIYIDDSAMECAEVMTNCPRVLTLRLPEDSSQIPQYLKHIWALDRFRVTEEDQNRAQLYRAEMRRRETLTTGLSLAGFLQELELKMSMNLMEKPEIPRVSQLTQRTNQFNLSTIRRTEREIATLVQEPDIRYWVIRVSDRFGDYGLVGVIITKQEEERLLIDTFLLSCRVLSRGIEEAALSGLKRYCLGEGLNRLEAKFYPTEKNRPFLEFLEKTGWVELGKGEINDYDSERERGYVRYGMKVETIPESIKYIDFYYKSHYPGNEIKEQTQEETVLLVQTAAAEFWPEKANSVMGKFPENNWKIIKVNEQNLQHRNHLIPLENYSGKKLLELPAHEVKDRISRAPYVAPSTEIEETLAKIWGEILGVEKIGIHDSFFELGGHSLKAVAMISRIQKEFGIELTLSEVFTFRTMAGLAGAIGEKRIGDVTANRRKIFERPIQAVSEKEFYPVSSAQKRLFLLNQMEKDLISYNMAGATVIEGPLNRERLDQVFQTLVKRHESFRTSFAMIDGEPAQRIQQDLAFKIDYRELNQDPAFLESESEERIKEIVQSFIQPFDFSRAPLLRVGLIKLTKQKHLLMYDMSHIISDGVSMGILTQEFIRLYNGEELPPLSIRYRDFSAWQNELLQTDQVREQEEYWRQVFREEIPALNLLPDYPRPLIFSFQGARTGFEIGSELTGKLNRLASDRGVTLYMLLLAVYNVLLFKYTGQEDIIVGSPVAGRTREDLEKIIGMFVNTLAIRNYPQGKKTFDEFLSEVKEITLKAFENQDYQFEELVEKLSIRRDLSRNPLFDTMFAVQNMEKSAIEIAGLKFTPYEFDSGGAKFDLTVNAIEQEGKITFELEYCAKLFKPETIQRFTGHFQNIIREIIEHPDLKLAEIRMLSQTEKTEIICGFNDTQAEYPQDKLIQELFQEQVEKTPVCIALISGEQQLSYQELHTRSNKLARILRNKGVHRDRVVGILLKRSPEMIVSIMGILKAGGAYLPIDPEYPVERMEYMLEDSETEILLSKQYLAKKVKFTGKIIDPDGEEVPRADGSNLEKINTAKDMAYIIYTSGSTGKPKGVMLEHRAVHNFINGISHKIDFSPGKTILSLTTISFDIFVLETILPLSKGLTLVLADEDQQRDAKLLSEGIIKNRVEMVQMTPSRLQLLLRDNQHRSCLRNLREIMVGGETFPENLREELSQHSQAKIYNMYGPTETTVWSSLKNLTGTDEINIGMPIANTQMYIVDPYFNLQPVGVPGELCIAGDGLARGYLNRPDLTAEKFVPNPFSSVQLTVDSGQLSTYNAQPNNNCQLYTVNYQLYKTGDLARWLPDGNIQFLGRVDNQVKVRGFRIELGEIEKCLQDYQGIKECVVAAREDNSRNRYLVGYYVADEEIIVSEIRAHLARSLPDYMIPEVICRLDRLPLTPNGKVNRKALPEPEGDRPSLGVDYRAPENEVEQTLVRIWQVILQRDLIGVNDNFFELGGNSLRLVLMHSRIEEEYPGKVEVADLFAYPTIARLARFIGGKDELLNLEGLKRAEFSGDQTVKIENSPKEIAIIGITGKFATANNVEEFWEGLVIGQDFIREFPKTRRQDLEPYLGFWENTGLVEKTLAFGEGGFLREIDQFDCSLFNISPSEAGLMDPNQRLFLEAAWSVSEDAGYGGKKLAGTRTGVYVGYSSDFGEEYRKYLQLMAPDAAGLSMPGNIRSIIAGRIAYLLDLKGPSMVVDTACSSALVAVHLACQGIRNGECSQAIAGGVRVNLIPLHGNGEGIGIESSDGRARTFDDHSDGTGLGEGVGAVFLKPLSKAIDDGDHIYAVIKGSAVNQDGSSVGITAPNSAAQEDVILRAWEDADIAPETISYIEAHGTGTKLGDPIEISGIQRAFRKYTSRKQFCAVGSVKTNVGHLDNAAGIVSLIKTVLMLKRERIPASLHFLKPNRKIDFTEAPVYVNDRLTVWEKESFPRRCGISSFGLSGTNCHLVLEEAPETKKIDLVRERKTQVLALSAGCKESLAELVRDYREVLSRGPAADLEDICYTANTGRGHYSHRLVILVKNGEDLRAKINDLFRNGFAEISEKGIYYGEHQIVSPRQVIRRKDELTEKEREELTREANRKIKELATVGEAEYEATLHQFCRFYSSGANPEWEELYQSERRSKVSLPDYPFQRKRRWIEPVPPAGGFQGKTRQIIGHPFVEFFLTGTLEMDLYVTVFGVDKQWALSEHKVAGNYVLPGTAYLEIAREIARKYYPTGLLELKDFLFLTPLVLDEGETREVQITVKNKGDFLELTITGRRGPGEEWLKHAEGKIAPLNGDEGPVLRLEEIRSRYLETGETERIERSGVIETGPRWNNLQKIVSGDGAALADLELPAEFADDLHIFGIHPALMDCAVNLAIGKVGSGLYLPFSYQSLKFYGSMPGRFHSYLRKKDGFREGAETASFDISLMDGQGKVFIDVEGYTLKKVPANELQYLDGALFYEIVWVPAELTGMRRDLPGGTVLIFKDEKGIAERLIQRLQGAGREIIEIEAGTGYQEVSPGKFIIGENGEDYQRLLGEVGANGLSWIIHLMSIAEYQTLEERLARGVYSLFHLTKALVKQKFQEKLEIVLLSDCANEVTGKETRINSHQAALFGLGKVVSQENPGLSCRCIDIDENNTLDEIDRELTTVEKTFQVAYRGSQRYLEEFREVNQEKVQNRAIALKNEGVYLITGGTGGIGLEIGKYLASKGQVTLALLNRSKMPEREKWAEILAQNEDPKTCRKIKAVQEIERTGAVVQCYGVDISKAEELGAVVSELRKKYGRINGVIHSAGVAGDGYIFRKDEKAFREVIAPKILGTQLLDQFTAVDDPDFFVMFSSINAFLGGTGQGDYTAANSFLDAYALDRQRRGKRTLSINWPPWKETGMAVDFGTKVDEGIFKPLTTSAALKAFEKFFNSNRTRVIIGELNYRVVRDSEDSIPFQVSNRIKSSIAGKQGNIKGSRRAAEQKVLEKVVLKGREGQDYTLTEQKLGQIWGTVLGLTEINIYDHFTDLGGDSIIAVKLTSYIEDFWGLEISVANIFEYLSIHELAKFLVPQTGEEKSPEKAGQESDVPRVSHIREPFKNINLASEFIESINNLTWRNMNCFDRAVNLLIAKEGPELVNYFKLFLGLERGYYLKEFGFDYNYQEEIAAFKYPSNNLLLKKMGLRINPEKISNPLSLHEIIIDLIDLGKPVLTAFDEYYTFYTPFYLKQHTDHRTVITGYDTDKKLYSIINYNHLAGLNAQKINYSQFYTPFAVMEEIYAGLKAEERFVLTLNEPGELEEFVVNTLKNQFVEILEHLTRNKAIGNDTEAVLKITSQEDEYFNPDNFTEIYLYLGGKELFLDTLLNSFLTDERNGKVRDLSGKLLTASDKLVNKYVAGVYKNKRLTEDALAGYVEEIRTNSENLFRELLETKR